LLSAESPPARGGVGDYTACLAAALAQAGREVDVLTSAGEDDAPGSAPGVTVHREVTDWGWGAAREVERVLRRVRPSVACIQYQTGAYRLRGAINLLPRRLLLPGRAWVTTFHDLREPYLFPKAGRLRRLANEELMRSSRAIVVTNPEDEAALPAWARDRAVGIPIGANIAPAAPPGFDRAELRASYGVPPRRTLVAYFGFLNVSKGLDTLLDALALLRSRGGDYGLLVVGGGMSASDTTDQATAAAFQSQVAARQLEEVIYRVGYVAPNAVSAALLSADMAALPFRDGASLRRGSLLAVMAHGLPTVTTYPTPQPLSPQAISTWPALRDGENVRLVPPEDAAALADALARLAGDSDIRERLRAGALTLAAQFDWDEIAARYLALFEQLERERT